MKLALLLALIMPLQGFAAAWACGSFDTAPATGAAAPKHCAHDTGVAQQHHHCGTCCCAAVIAVMPLFRVPPRPANPGLLLPVRSPPAIVLDRLDRPPRLV